MFKLSGVHVKHCKNTAKLKAERIPTPKSVTVPMSMHIGAPAVPIVKVGDTVKVGQLIGEAGPGLSSPVYSGVSGTVKKIDGIISITQISTIYIITATNSISTTSDSRTEGILSVDRSRLFNGLSK